MAEQPANRSTGVEVSERSSTLVVPPLSRYARSQSKDGGEDTGEDANAAESEPIVIRGVTTHLVQDMDTAPLPVEAPTPGGPAALASEKRERPPAPPLETKAAPPSEAEPSVEQRAPTREKPAPRLGEAGETAAAPRTTRSELIPASMPDPSTRPHEHEARRPFWKRLGIGLGNGAAGALSARDAASTERVLARLADLEARIGRERTELRAQLDQMEANLGVLMEQEQRNGLAEIRERLALIEANQVEIADGLHAVSRNFSILALVLALAVAGGAITAGILL